MSFDQPVERPSKSPLFSATARWLKRVVNVRPDEIRALGWSFALFFCLMCGYYVLRAIRDEMGISGGLSNLPWLFTATFLCMVVLVPIYGWLTSHFPRRTFVPMVYGFFVVNLLVFFGLYKSDIDQTLLARVFFVWISVYNLFIVSVFWSLMADIFDSERAKRLFGFIASGATIGGLVGPLFPALLAESVGALNLLLVTALLLCFAIICVNRLVFWQHELAFEKPQIDANAQLMGGGLFEAFGLVLRSSYLMGVCLLVFFYTMLGTFVYFQRSAIIEQSFTDSDTRTAVFAWMDFVTNGLTLLIEWFITGRLVKRFGLWTTLMVLPVLMGIGFLILGVSPIFSVIIVFEVLRRSTNYAINRPSREMLFTVTSAQEKYRAKAFIDTVIYRGGDTVSGWLYAGMQALGMALGTIAFMAVPICMLWAVLGFAMGKRQEALENNIQN